MFLVKNRTASFVLVALVYVLSAFVGISVYNALSFSFFINLLIADVVATIVTFIFSLIFKNASVYDPYWSVQPLVILWALAFNAEMNLYNWLVIAVVSAWGIRLTANWAYTFLGLEYQDWRYTMLNEKTGKFYPFVNFIGIHLVPTLVVYFCVLPVVFTFKYESNVNFYSLIFLFLSICAIALQGVSDIQMHSYRKRRRLGLISEIFIRDGFWKYSRHPNYLGEILMWWGVGLSAVFAMGGRVHLLVGALMNTCLFLFVSIPLAEDKQSKKDGYYEYKNETHALFPIKKIH